MHILRTTIIVFIVFGSGFSSAQTDQFDIEYPWSHNVERLKVDKNDFFWLRDDSDFYYYNGHQVSALGLGQLIQKKAYDYHLIGDIILVDDQLLFANDQTLSLVHPHSMEVKDLWTLPDGLKFDHIYEDDLGHIWVFAQSLHSTDRPVFISENGEIFSEAFDLYDQISDRGIFWDFEISDLDGLLYIQWRLGDFLIINDKGEEQNLVVADIEDFKFRKNCSQFRLDNNNKLWRIRDMHFEIYDSTTQRFDTHPLTNNFEFSNYCNIDEGRSLLNLRSVYEDSKGRIWMTFSASYLIMYDPNTDISTPFRAPLVEELEGGSVDIKSIVEDKDGNIWGNKEGGLFKLRDIVNFFESYAVNTSEEQHDIYKGKDQNTIHAIRSFYGDFAIRNTVVHDIAESPDKSIIIQDGTYTFKIDRLKKEIEALPIVAPKEKVHFYKDSDVTLYGTWDAYYILDEVYKATKSPYPINKIENTIRLQNGNIWVSGLLSQHENMFGKLNSETYEYEGNHIDQNGLIDFSGTLVNSIVEDDQGRLWLGTDEGIFFFHPESDSSIQAVSHSLLFEGNTIDIGQQIENIQFVQNNLLWFKSKYEIGLLDVHQMKLLKYLSLETAPYNTASTFVPEGDSALWIGYQDGLIYHHIDKNDFFTVTKNEGLDSRGNINVLLKLSSDEIAAGTNNGLYIYKPADIIKYHKNNIALDQQTPLFLTSYNFQEGHNDEYRDFRFFSSSDVSIDLDYNDRSLNLQFALSNYNYPERQRYTHILEGYESSWSAPSPSNAISYTAIPPGEYTLKVKGDIGKGIWTEESLDIPIRVRQAWFRSWWFIIGIFLFLSYIIYRASKFYFSQELEKRKSIEDLRNKISSNLHDDVGTILTGIAMQSELLENSVDDNSRTLARTIAERSREAMSNMRDTVWAVDNRKDSIGDLKDRMIDFLDDTFAHKEIQYRITDEATDLNTPLPPDIRQAAYLIFKESIINIVKHSDTKEVILSLGLSKSNLTFTIQDRGQKKERIKTSGLGLTSIRERALQVNGSYQFVYDEGYRTEVILPISS